MGAGGRPRGVWLALIAATIALGLGSRRFGAWLPPFVAAYAGDALWALALFLGIGLVWPRASTRAVAVAALAGCLAVELSQLYHAPWLDAIRATTLGALVLGQGFLWSDLACYAVGVAAGVGIEGAVRGLLARRRAGKVVPAGEGRPPATGG